MLNRSSTNRVPSGTYKPGFLDKAKAGEYLVESLRKGREERMLTVLVGLDSV